MDKGSIVYAYAAGVTDFPVGVPYAFYSGVIVYLLTD